MFKQLAGPVSAASLLTASLLLTGCTGGGVNDLKQTIERIKASKNEYTEPAPSFNGNNAFDYDAKDQRDPFLPAPKKFNDNSRRMVGHQREALELFSIDQLRLVGSLEKDNKLWALVKAGNGTVYRVTNGNYIGPNQGKITRVTEDKLFYTEYIEDVLGNWVERSAQMAMQ